MKPKLQIALLLALPAFVNAAVNDTSTHFAGGVTLSGIATADLGTSTFTNEVKYCTDCITAYGTGDLVVWDGANWRTLRNRVMATTDFATYLFSCQTNALRYTTSIEDRDVLVVSGASTIGLNRSFAGAGVGATAGNSSDSTTFGTQISYVTGSSSVGAARAWGSLFAAISSGDSYSVGGQYAVSAAPDGSDNFICWIGFGNATTNYPGEGAWFLQDRWNKTGHGKNYTNNWILVTAHSSGYSFADSGLPFSAVSTSPQKLDLILTTTGANFYTNRVLAGTIATTLPTTGLYLVVENLKTDGGNSRTLFEYSPYFHRRHAVHLY